MYRFLTAAAVVFSLSQPSQAQEGTPYKLGVQDRLRIHVHEWPVLTGEFAVGANGTLVLPLIGAIIVKGLELGEVTTEIAKRLSERVGTSTAPETTVDIAQYRPFYILGGVERPGEYQFRPGMLVVNAVAIAGGFYRPPRTSDWGFERDAITGRGDLRLASIRRDELHAKEIRLNAEAEGLEEFPVLPTDLSSGARKFIEDERLLFAARLQRYRNQSIALNESIELFEGEIKTLQDQIESARKQEASVARELEDTRGLVARSVLPAPRILPIERTLAQIEREKKEIETSIVRSRQQINSLKSQRETLKDERRSTALTELQVLDVQRKELQERVETAARLIAGSNAMSANPQETSDVETSSYSIVRQRDDKVIELSAVETTVLQPGDVLKVFRPQDVRASRSNAGTTGDRRSAMQTLE